MTQLLSVGEKALEYVDNKKTCATGASTCEVQKCELLGGSRGIPPGKSLKSGPLRLHFQHSGAKIRVFEQSTDILNFGFFGGNFQRRVGSKFR